MLRAFSCISLDERRVPALLRDAGDPVARIAEPIGRHPATIDWELKRNDFAVVANDPAKERRGRDRKLRRAPAHARIVVERLQ